MKDFIAQTDLQALNAAGLADFEALWRLDLASVDEPNIRRGGVSSVCFLKIGSARYYLKRQQGYFTRSLHHPFGESLCAREWRNIQKFQRLNIAAVTCAYFGTRDSGKEQRAILLTHALDGFNDLCSYLKNWQTLASGQRQAIVCCCGALAKNLHQARQKHGCLYPKHIFLRQTQDDWQSCLIDLEKARPLLPFQRDRISDLEPLLRRSEPWSADEQRLFLRSYLPQGENLTPWLERLSARSQRKQAR
ncbi:lipopolysaccharide kinase [Ventosimonas gracilis]|uniref:Lipopolysaccharide kinase n=1 Tax=Ventosimonas gracilis TaxID=1680762 RepID=A0A139SV46_9GAMM|nr:lipopolysaccharide kinase InaA family protein [Ventosimonas gracilis]KXU38433.1 lipopolysaccharide kinase [Ventosimonas gracilis]